MAIDFVVLFLALPIGVSRTYGFQTAKWVFTETLNGTGAVSIFLVYAGSVLQTNFYFF